MTSWTRTCAAFVSSALVAVALVACARKPAFPVAHTYVVRGQVTQVPAKGKPFSEFRVSHEAIPDFYNAEGEKEGMQAMNMPFPCLDGGLLSHIQVGDKIQMTVLVSKDLTQWDIAEMQKLPPHEPLQLAK